MNMEIVVEGSRVTATDWRAVSSLPADQLPPLTPAQKEVAQKMRIREEDYARSLLANKQGAKYLLAKTERLARFLQQQLRAKEAGGRIDRVTLNTWQESFEVEMTVNGASLPVRIDESIVDDLLERGSAEAEQRLSRIVDITLQTRAR